MTITIAFAPTHLHVIVICTFWQLSYPFPVANIVDSQCCSLMADRPAMIVLAIFLTVT